ncbi:PhpK family radical SAM P-methyltransferase [Terasakiella sp.]|uniref:PhpK family radical SAM P-methyltransferase n=1 Tax=Terasakiella sp. TaxID=2034861 RepID=UPI003AA86E0B
MMHTDCLIIGFNDFDFEKTVDMIRGNDPTSGGYRDINLAFLNMQGHPHHAMDILNHVNGWEPRTYHNSDFVWPVVLCLSSYLAKNGFTFDYINLFQHEKDALRDKLEKGGIRTVAITTTLYVVPQPIIEIVQFIRTHNTDVEIVIGGPFISSQAAMLDADGLSELFSYLGGDYYVISSEGEKALCDLLDALKTQKNLADIENIAYRQKDTFVHSTISVERNSLEENSVDYSLFAKEKFGQFLSLRTAKSCPFSCAFCGFPDRAGKYTYLDLAHVERTLDSIKNLGTVNTLTFLDDTFNVPKKRFREIMQLMIDKGYGFKWNSFYRSDHGDEATIDLMQRAGCEGVFLGVESGSDAILEKMNKKSRRKDYLSAIKMFRERDILTHCNLIIGFPGETPDTVAESMSFLEESKSDFYRAQLWFCDPITPVWKQKEELGIENFAFNWSHNTMNCQQATAFVEQMFLEVQNSIWLPQQGFEMWSLFYLQRNGFSREQIKGFLRAFNDGIREKLLIPDQQEPSEQILKNLSYWGRRDGFDHLRGMNNHPPLYAPHTPPTNTALHNNDQFEAFAF